MRRRDLSEILEKTSAGITSFYLADTYIFSVCKNGIMKGINLDPSGLNKKMFYAAAFVMPLYVPSEDVTLLFSKRLETFDVGWYGFDADIVLRLKDAFECQAMPYLASMETPLQFADVTSARCSANPHFPHAIALSLAKAGEHDRAIALIDDFLPKMHRTRDWEQRIFDECTFFRDLLARDSDAAHRQLFAWEDYTVGQLGLEKFRAAASSR